MTEKTTAGKASQAMRLAGSLVEFACQISDQYAGRLVEIASIGERRELENPRHRSNFLSEFDIELHRRYKTRLSDLIPSFVYASEEAEPEILGKTITDDAEWPDTLVLVDPLDTSELAVRALMGYTHVLVYSLADQAPIAAVVGDLFHEIRAYVAYRGEDSVDHAYMVTRSGKEIPLRTSSQNHLDRALITNYSMRPVERFLPLARQERLLHSLGRPDDSGRASGRIGVDFGSVGLCHVAAGLTDGMVEIAKGFALWDLFPGQYILHAAGGTVRSLDGNELPLSLGLRNLSDVSAAMERRQKFVAAGRGELAEALLDLLIP